MTALEGGYRHAARSRSGRPCYVIVPRFVPFTFQRELEEPVKIPPPDLSNKDTCQANTVSTSRSNPRPYGTNITAFLRRTSDYETFRLTPRVLIVNFPSGSLYSIYISADSCDRAFSFDRSTGNACRLTL